jgi:hypothetical protein
MSITTLANAIIAEQTYENDQEEEISTDEETVFDEDYVSAPRTKKVKFCEQERKQQIKERQIEKCAQRNSREPGVRLGKNAKKVAGRRAFIDNWADTDEFEPVQDSVTDKGEQKTFGRIKRKPGHRQREAAFCDN